jgi:adenine-specific DNA-methyltransferase
MFWKDEAPNTKSIMTRTALDNSDTQEELIEKIRKLQKEVDRLNAQLKEKRFGLTWIDVPEAFEKESENKIPVLEEVPELAIHNDD